MSAPARTRRSHIFRMGLISCLVALASPVIEAQPAVAQVLPCAEPTFVDGLSQNVFTSTSAQWVNGEAWVEAPFDSDADGKLDRIHIDITRPPETADPQCDYKAPVIFEDSPD